MRELREFLAGGAVVFLSISSQYGGQRIKNLTDDAAAVCPWDWPAIAPFRSGWQ